jgi:hypothetical protein
MITTHHLAASVQTVRPVMGDLELVLANMNDRRRRVVVFLRSAESSLAVFIGTRRKADAFMEAFLFVFGEA